MALVLTDLAPVGSAAINSVPRTVWMYSTSDTLATVVASGYFVDAGSDSGNEQLKANDTILVDANGVLATLRVSDAAAGDAVVSSGGGVQQANIAPLTGSLTGSTDDVMEDVADIALSTGDSYTDAAVNAAVNAAILGTNLQLKELQVKLNEVLTALDGYGLTL